MSLAVIDRIANSPFWKKFESQAAAADEADRAARHAAFCAEADRAIASAAEMLGQLEKADRKAAEESEKAQAVADKKRADFMTIRRKIENVKAERTARLNALEGRRRDTADPRIHEAIDAINDRIALMRRGGITTEQRYVRNLETDTGASLHYTSNARSFGGIVRASTQARQELEQLKQIEVPDVGAAIAAITARIPWASIDVLETDGPSAA